MPGKYQYNIELKSNVAKLLTDMKEVQDRLDTVEGKEYKIKLNIDEKKLSNVISNLEKMLDSLGKGTGDFKQFENLSKELSSIVSEVQNLSKAFGKVDDSGTKTLLSSIQNIDKSLSELSQHIINVNKNMSNIGGDTNSAVKQVENISNAYDNATKSAEKLAEAQSKIGNKSNISSGTQIKDVFQDDDKINTDASTTAIKEESRALEQVSTSAKDAATSKEKFANANKEVKASAESSSTSLNEEKKKFENVGDSAEETKKKLDDVVFKPNTEGFDEIVSKLDIAKDKIEEISKITKSSVWSESQGEYLESYNIKYKNGTSEIRGESSNKKGSNVLRSNEVAYDAKVAEQEAKAVKEVWDKNVKAIQDYMDAVTKLNNLNAKDKGTGKYASQITLQEKNVEELKEKALEARTAITSMINPHDVSLNTWRDYLDVMKKFDQASLGSAESVAKLEDALRKMDFSSLESAGTKFDSQFKNLSIKPDGDHQFLSWTNDLKELNAKIDEYNSKVKYLKENNIVDGEQVVEVKNLRDEIEQTINVMTKTPQAKRGWTDIGASKAAEKVANVLKQNTKMSKEAKDAIRAYYNELRSGNPSQPIDEILVKVNQLVQKERELGRVGKSFGEIFKEKVIYGGAAQLAGMVGFYDLINIGREIVTNIKEVDTALTELRKVSDATEQRLTTNFKNSADTAKELGATISDVISATADWSRMGYNIDQAEELARVSTLYKNVGDGIDIETANNSLISTLQGFQLDASEAESIIDKFNEVANNYAIDSAGIGEALQRSAASFNAANTDLSKSIALITATNEVVQDPDSVGTLWKTMSARIRGAETELQQLNEETDEYTKTTSKLRDLVMGLTGFDIMEDEDTFKDIYEIILGIGQEWQNLTDAEQASLGEALAGKRNANALYAVLGNLDTLQSAYETAENSAGSAMREQENYEKSIQYSLDRLSASAQEWSNTLVSSDVIKWFVDLANAAVELSTALTPLGTIALGGGIFAGFKNIGRPKNVWSL